MVRALLQSSDLAAAEAASPLAKDEADRRRRHGRGAGEATELFWKSSLRRSTSPENGERTTGASLR